MSFSASEIPGNGLESDDVGLGLNNEVSVKLHMASSTSGMQIQKIGMHEPLGIRESIIASSQALQLREERIASSISLTCNENALSHTARNYLSSRLDEKYFFGGGDKGVVDFVSFTFAGIPEVQEFIGKAERILKYHLNCTGVFWGALSGIQAMMASVLSLSAPGDLVMSVNPDNGGHAMTKGLIESLGRKHSYLISRSKSSEFDLNRCAELLKAHIPKIVYIDLATYTHHPDIRSLKQVLPPETLLVCDVSHSLGLILGHVAENPLELGADMLTANTHKTFPGPQRGLVLVGKRLSPQSIIQQLQMTVSSSIHIGSLLALCHTILEMGEFAGAYSRALIENSKLMERCLLEGGASLRQERGDLLGTQNEQIHHFIQPSGQRAELFQRLIDNGIITNFLTTYGGQPFARLGVQEITRRGIAGRSTERLCELYLRALGGSKVLREVGQFMNDFQKVHFSLD